MDLYEVIHIPSGKKYIGITYKTGKTYLDRFSEHMIHKGSLQISNMIHSGSDISEFTTNLIYSTDKLYELFILETMYIIENKTLGISLNMNYGGGFIGKKYFSNSEYKDRGYDVNIYSEVYIPTIIQSNIDGLLNINYNTLDMLGRMNIKRVLSVSFFIDNLFQYVNDKIIYYDFYKIVKKYARAIYFAFKGLSDDIRKMYLITFIQNESMFTVYFNILLLSTIQEQSRVAVNNLFFKAFFLSKHANLEPYFRNKYGSKINSPIETDGWKDGRENYSIRMKTKSFTIAEIEKFKSNSKNVQAHWDNQTISYKLNRTLPGLTTMNDKIHTCIHCNKDMLTLGNLNRHHNSNCKYKGMTIEEITISKLKPPKQIHICDFCGKELTNKGHMTFHQRKCKGVNLA